MVTIGKIPFVVIAGHSDNTIVIEAGNDLGEPNPSYVIRKSVRFSTL